MSYEILIFRRASKQLSDLPLRDYERVKRSVSTLADNPRPNGCLKLTGRSGGELEWAIIELSTKLMIRIEL